MNQHPLQLAFEHLDDEASVDFRDALLARLLSDLGEPATARESGVPVGTEQQNGDEIELFDNLPEITVVGLKTRSRSGARLVSIAAAIVAILGIAVVTVRGPGRAGVDTRRDRAIAEAALLTADMVDRHWTGAAHRFDALTSRVAADLAATIPECVPYVDYAFDSPRREAATAGRVLVDENRQYLFQWVYVFSTEDAASRVMDKISEPSFVTCFNRLSEASFPVLVPGYTSTMTTVEASPITPYGDRQVVFGTYATSDLNPYPPPVFPTRTVNVFVQVGRGIVYVNPTPDFHENSDPHGDVDIAISAAVNALADALEARV